MLLVIILLVIILLVIKLFRIFVKIIMFEDYGEETFYIRRRNIR